MWLQDQALGWGGSLLKDTPTPQQRAGYPRGRDLAKITPKSSREAPSLTPRDLLLGHFTTQKSQPLTCKWDSRPWIRGRGWWWGGIQSGQFTGVHGQSPWGQAAPPVVAAHAASQGGLAPLAGGTLGQACQGTGTAQVHEPHTRPHPQDAVTCQGHKGCALQ